MLSAVCILFLLNLSLSFVKHVRVRVNYITVPPCAPWCLTAACRHFCFSFVSWATAASGGWLNKLHLVFDIYTFDLLLSLRSSFSGPTWLTLTVKYICKAFHRYICVCFVLFCFCFFSPFPVWIEARGLFYFVVGFTFEFSCPDVIITDLTTDSNNTLLSCLVLYWFHLFTVPWKVSHGFFLLRTSTAFLCFIVFVCLF